MHRDIQQILFGEEELKQKVNEAAAWLDKKFEGSGSFPLAICVLKGSVLFFCDLVRAMNTPVQLDFTTVSSYGNDTKSSGKPQIKNESSASVEGRDVILVEDIVDSGLTMEIMKKTILSRGAKSFTSVALFNKAARRVTAEGADYACFEVGDEFIVGYGLDYAQKYRNLPYVGVLKREIYEH